MTRFDLEMALREQIESPYLPLSMMGNILQTGNICRGGRLSGWRKDFFHVWINVYRGDTAEPAYDLGEPKIILYNLQYRKYMIHGIEDYMYNLDLEESLSSG